MVTFLKKLRTASQQHSDLMHKASKDDEEKPILPPRPSFLKDALINQLISKDDRIPISPKMPSRNLSNSQKSLAKSDIVQYSRTEKKGFLHHLFGGMFGHEEQQRPPISTPFNPVHISHVGYNKDTGEFTGLPDRWQRLVDESLSVQDKEENHEAILEVIDFIKQQETVTLDDYAFSKFNHAQYYDPASPILSPANSPSLPRKTVNKSTGLAPPKPPRIKDFCRNPSEEEKRPPLPARPTSMLMADIKPFTPNLIFSDTKDADKAPKPIELGSS